MTVYDPKHAGFTLDTSVSAPAQTPSDKAWKYQLKPSSPAAYSGTFDYDSKGRATDVWKLQSTTTNPWTYVQTHTTYGADTDGSWGQAQNVVEDYGVGHVNRTTQNLHYTAWGKADQVQDAAGHVFSTTYDLDGQVQSVALGGQTITSYVYGSTPGTVTYGQPVSLTDSLSSPAVTAQTSPTGQAAGPSASQSP